MKKIGKAETISDYNQQISYLEDILSTMEDLQTLFGKDAMFKDWYKDIENQMSWIEEQQQDLRNEKEEMMQPIIKQHDEEIKAMYYEFERSRL